ncbi:hypothetical protein [Alkalitalea saponilacus]|uniref:GAF domain-containing protein n=1 Tax=Alkalitalea saponilacus TaxID=889453 RepID=A0A1T5EBX1_9BACT|nr:hypothetical protein [Alkalitalea saponilacus]ASB49040.1 hypothetical protein CDL62_07765 [Alkalitalea saponilacus]SKB81438.1 hypothetical protein SAMN03080601_01280 [Alkalitalea saponilacus]
MKSTKLHKKHPFLVKIFSFALSMVILTVVKYIIFPESLSALFMTFDISTLIILLLIIYITDRYYRESSIQIRTLKTSFEQEKTGWDNERQSLLIKIKEFEDKENAATKFSSYQEKILKQLFESGKKSPTLHNFLHLMAEIFQAGAIILYKQTKPEGQFIVEETYALPDDFKPSPFSKGEGLNGQAVEDEKALEIDEIPESYFLINSGLGSAPGNILYLLPIIDTKNQNKYLIELITFKKSQIVKMWSKIAAKLVENNVL